jgi:hypothetical protein
MEVIAAIVVAAMSAIAAGIAAWIARASNSRVRELVATFENGKTETLTVSGSDKEQIRRSLREIVDLEDRVQRALGEHLNIDVKPGTRIDFIAYTSDGLIGFEVKNNLKAIGPSRIRRYLDDRSDLKKLVIVSNSRPGPKLRNSLQSWLDSGRLSFVDARDEGHLADALSKELHAPQ